jgi:hypothetical protein
MGLALLILRRFSQEVVMTHLVSAHPLLSGIARFFEHAIAIAVGLVMMIVGLGLGVTMIMLPVGLVVGLLGVAVFLGGIFVHIDETGV